MEPDQQAITLGYQNRGGKMYSSVKAHDESTQPDEICMKLIGESIEPVFHIHIGNGKTGSTAIQKALEGNAKYLRAHGILYLGICFENLSKKHFPWNTSDGSDQLLKLDASDVFDQVAFCLEQALIEARYENLQAIVWSNEWLFSNSQRVALALERISDRCCLHVIAYVRRQDRWVISAYKQWGVRHKTYAGPVLSFPEWYERYFSRQQLDYENILSKWRQSLPHTRFSVRIYERHRDVSEDFFGLLGIPYASLPIQVGRCYETPDDWVLSYQALFNNLFADPVHPRELVPLIRRSGLEKLGPPHPIDFDLPDEIFLRRLLEQMQLSNQRLADAFSTPDYPVSFDDAPVSSKPMSLAEPVALIAGLLKMTHCLDKEVRDLRQEVEGLRKQISSQGKSGTIGSAADGRQRRKAAWRRIAVGVWIDRGFLQNTPTLLSAQEAIGDAIDVFWIADESTDVPDVPRIPKLVYRFEDLSAMGLSISGPRVSWYYKDYSFYRLIEDAPGYDYYLVVDYCVLLKTGLISRLIGMISDSDVDFVACQFSLRSQQWHWWENASHHFEAVYGALFPFVLCSASAIKHLFTRRIETAGALPATERWPFCESFVPSTLVRDGFCCMDLNQLIPHAWSPRTFSVDKPIWAGEAHGLLGDQCLISPVLDGAEYADKLKAWLRINNMLGDSARSCVSCFGTELSGDLVRLIEVAS